MPPVTAAKRTKQARCNRTNEANPESSWKQTRHAKQQQWG